MDTYNPDKTWKVTEDDWPEEDENRRNGIGIEQGRVNVLEQKDVRRI
jgi:hypothetical protein